METHSVYCSACDRKVTVAFEATPVSPGRAGEEIDPAGVCLDVCTSACTGTMCPLFDSPPAEMIQRLRGAIGQRELSADECLDS